MIIRTNEVSNKSKCGEKFSYTFATRLRKARKHLNLTQEEVAELIGVQPRTYQHYEALSISNIRVPNFEIINKLSKVLDCDLSYFTGENDEDVYKKEIANAAEVAGVKYETIETLKRQSRKKDIESRFVFQVIDLICKSEKDFINICSNIASELFLMNYKETLMLESTHDNYLDQMTDEEYDSITYYRGKKQFIDAIDFDPFYVCYDERIYIPYTEGEKYKFSSYLSPYRRREKEFRDSYEGNVEVLITSFNSIRDMHDEIIQDCNIGFNSSYKVEPNTKIKIEIKEISDNCTN